MKITLEGNSEKVSKLRKELVLRLKRDRIVLKEEKEEVKTEEKKAKKQKNNG